MVSESSLSFLQAARTKSMPYLSISCRKPRAQTLFEAMRDLRSSPTYSGSRHCSVRFLKTSSADPAVLHQLDAAAAHALVEDLGGAAAQDAAGVGGVGHARRPGDQLALGKIGLTIISS